MEITLANHTRSDVDLFSVDSMSKRERMEGTVPPGVSNSFYVPGAPSELRIKDSNTEATIHTESVSFLPRPLYTGSWRIGETWEHYIDIEVRQAQTVVSDYSGLWTYRLFDPSATWDKIPQKERDLILADGFVFNFRTPTSTTLEGTFESRDGGLPLLNLRGTVRPGVGDEPASFDIVGTGRSDSGTADWEYHYHGHLIRKWPHVVDQRPALVGSVIRVKPHNGQPGGGWRSEAGTVYSFIAVAVKPQPPFTWELSGSWAYRSFRNNPQQVYPVRADPRRPRQDTAEWPSPKQLILAEGVFKLESPTNTTLQGAYEPSGTGTLQVVTFSDLRGTVRLEDAGFEIVGTGRRTRKEYHYQGHLTRKWTNPNGIERPVDAAQALVGSFVQSPNERSLPALCFHFIAVKQRIMTLNSTAFHQNGDIPSKYTCEGEAGVRDVSPPLAWEGVPNGTKSLVLIMDDPDAPDPNAPQMVWVHWVVYNIPPDTKSLPENAGRAGLPQGALHGRNDFAIQDPQDPRATGYGGPCPPIGRHRYFHKLYALDITLDLRDATKSQIVQAMRDHVLANAELIGTYQKRNP
jgi:Raf kinase inhibitor-like YbhB/YbcL family protein